MLFWWLHIDEEQAVSMQGIKTRNDYVGVKEQRKKEKESARNILAKMKDINLDVGYWSREITSIGAMTYCEGTSVESSLEPQGLRPDWEMIIFGAPSPPAWRGKTWWTMENNGDYSCEKRTDLQFPSPFCMAHFLVDKNRPFFSDFRLQTSDFRDIYLNRIAEKVNQYLSGCVHVDEKYGT